MFPRGAAVATVGLLVLAGCAGIVPDPGGGECPAYPPGTGPEGIDNATVLLRSHGRAVAAGPYAGRAELRITERDVTNNRRTVLTYDAFRIYAAPGVPRYASTGVGGTGFWNGTVRYAMFSDRERGTTAFVRSRDQPIGPARRTGLYYLSRYAFLRGGDYGRTGVVTGPGGESLVKFRATAIVDRDALPGDGYFYRNATSLNATLLVDPGGWVRFAHVVVRARRSADAIVRAELTLRYRRIDRADVPRPGWVGVARGELRDAAGRSVTVEAAFDPGVPPLGGPSPNDTARANASGEC